MSYLEHYIILSLCNIYNEFVISRFNCYCLQLFNWYFFLYLHLFNWFRCLW